MPLQCYQDQGTYCPAQRQAPAIPFVASTCGLQFQQLREVHFAAYLLLVTNLWLYSIVCNPTKEKGNGYTVPNILRVISTSFQICSSNTSTESNFSSSRRRATNSSRISSP